MEEAKLEIDPPLEEWWGTAFDDLVIELDQREVGRCRVDANSDSPNPVKYLNVNIPALEEDLEGDTHRVQVRINADSGWAKYTYIYEYHE